MCGDGGSDTEEKSEDHWNLKIVWFKIIEQFSVCVLKSPIITIEIGIKKMADNQFPKLSVTKRIVIGS